MEKNSSVGAAHPAGDEENNSSERHDETPDEEVSSLVTPFSQLLIFPFGPSRRLSKLFIKCIMLRYFTLTILEECLPYV